MRVVFHGLLRELYGESVEINASSIADAIEGVSTQLRDWPRKVGISVVGYNVREELYNSKPDEVHLMPAFSGGSGKVFNFIVGGAMIVAGVILTASGLGSIGIPLIISGSLMVLQGVVMLFMKTPKIEAEENPEDSKYLGLNQNTTASRTPITNAWGRIKLYPHWLSLQSDSSLMAHGAYPISPT